jgi:hypothetical protein
VWKSKTIINMYGQLIVKTLAHQINSKDKEGDFKQYTYIIYGDITVIY